MKKDFKRKVENQVRRLNLINRLKNSSIAKRVVSRLRQRGIRTLDIDF